MELYDIEELKGMALLNAINNMITQLIEDNNGVKNIKDITLQRIFGEIDSVGIKFDKKGNIVI